MVQFHRHLSQMIPVNYSFYKPNHNSASFVPISGLVWLQTLKGSTTTYS